MIQPLNAHYHKQNILFKCHQENETGMHQDQKAFQYFHQTMHPLCLVGWVTNLRIICLERVRGSLLSPNDHNIIFQHPNLADDNNTRDMSQHSPEASNSGWCRGQASWPTRPPGWSGLATPHWCPHCPVIIIIITIITIIITVTDLLGVPSAAHRHQAQVTLSVPHHGAAQLASGING